jgi:tRNA pseudouridine13 synthase
MKQFPQTETPPEYTGFIAYKLKVIPEDFQVKEIVSPEFNIKETGRYAIYLLAKSGWNTVDLLDMIARQNGIVYASTGYGGKKDRHAHTEQLVSIDTQYTKPAGRDRHRGNDSRRINHSRNDKDKSAFLQSAVNQSDVALKEVSGDKWKMKLIGMADRPVGPDIILCNEFNITLRSLHENEFPILKHNFEFIKKYGIPNYFDDQRFGGYDPALGFTSAHIINGDYNQALKSFMTFVYAGDKGPAKRRKYMLREAWGDWAKCEEIALTPKEKKIFAELRRSLKSSGAEKQQNVFLNQLDFISKEDLSMYYAALQSYIWNEMLKNKIIYINSENNPSGDASKQVSPAYQADNTYSADQSAESAKGVAKIKLGFGDLVFPVRSIHLQSDSKQNNHPLPADIIDSVVENVIADFQVPGPGTKYSDPFTQNLFIEELKKLAIAELKDPGLKAAYIKSFERKSWLFAETLNLSEIMEDDLFNKRKKATISFRLGSGSYATMIIKRLTLRIKT